MSVPTLFADSKIGLTKRLMELTGFGCVGIKLGKCKVTLIIGPLSHKRSYKITVVCLSVSLSIYLSVCLPACLPVCLSVFLFIRQFGIFVRNGRLLFSDFWHGARSLEYL